MKKYRLTKITVKTKEIVVMRKNAADENQTAVCPACQAPLAEALPAVENRTAELIPAADDRDEFSKGDI